MRRVGITQYQPQTQTNPSVDRFQYHARDTGSDSRWGWFGSGAETSNEAVFSAYVGSTL